MRFDFHSFCDLLVTDDLCSGKTLGGGTSINGGHYTRGLAAQYDAWLSLLDDDDADSGWDWEGMLGYMKKVCIDIFGSSHILYVISVRNILCAERSTEGQRRSIGCVVPWDEWTRSSDLSG